MRDRLRAWVASKRPSPETPTEAGALLFAYYMVLLLVEAGIRRAYEADAAADIMSTDAYTALFATANGGALDALVQFGFALPVLALVDLFGRLYFEVLLWVPQTAATAVLVMLFLLAYPLAARQFIAHADADIFETEDWESEVPDR